MAKAPKYSKDFERDYEWYLKWYPKFDFDARAFYTNKKGENLIVPDDNGRTAKECFFIYDSSGKIVPCKEPELYKNILKCKGSINFNIKQWAEAWGKAEIAGIEMIKIFEEFELLEWMKLSVYKQRTKYWDIERDTSIMKSHNESLCSRTNKNVVIKMFNLIFSAIKSIITSIIIKRIIK